MKNADSRMGLRILHYMRLYLAREFLNKKIV